MWKYNFAFVVCFLSNFCLNFPLEKCRSNKIDLVIHVATVTPIQKVRLKSIVKMFLPETDDEIINSRIAIFVSSNLTQPLIGFNTYNSSRDLLQKLENLNNSVERHLQVVETLQENSVRYFQEMEVHDALRYRVSIIVCEYCRRRYTDDIILPVNKIALNITVIENYIIWLTQYETISWNLQKFLNNAFITKTDYLSDNLFFSMSLCGECNNNWITFQSKSHLSKLSCYTFEMTYAPFNHFLSTSHCNALGGSHVALITSNEEFAFLIDSLQASLAIRSYNSNSSQLVYNTIICKRYIKHEQFSPWQNKKPHIFGLSEIENAKEDSCFALEFHLNESNTNEPWIQVSTDTDRSNLVLCEFDLDLLKLRESDIGYTNDDITGKLNENNINYVALNVKLFSCDSDKSIPYTMLHDAHDDCDDALDENVGGAPKLCDIACDIKSNPPIFERRCFTKKSICDGENQCMDMADEENCNVCMDMTLPDGTCLPSQWFYTEEKYFFYTPRRDEAIDKDKIKQVEEMLASCSGTECKHSEYVNIHVVRCQAGEYSNSSRLDLQHNVTWAAKCVYLKMRYRNQEGLGCSDKSHLANCEKFVCSNGLFKCPNSYCIPYYMVFDGHSDCPSGEEESIFIRNQIFSLQLFPCREPSVLIHHAHVCDGIDHCPTRDDELHCYEKCPSGFTCGFGVTEVTDHSKVNHPQLFKNIDRRTRVLVVSGINLQLVVFEDLDIRIYLVEFHLSNCGLNNTLYRNLINSFKFAFETLVFINLSYNDIDVNTNPKTAPYLHVLDLSHTSIQSLFVHVAIEQFWSNHYYKQTRTQRTDHCRYVEYLNLSSSHLKALPYLDSHTCIKTLDLRNTSLKYDDKTSQLLKSLSIKSAVYGDSYKLCCSKYSCPGIQSVKCFAPDDPVSSCNDLLGDVVKRTWLWLTGFIGTVGNIAVILIKLIKHNDLNTLTYTAFNIVLSDLIMSVYLLIIAGADVYYRDDYVLYDTEWRDSSLCKAAGFLATLSYTSSGVFVVLVTSQLFVLHRYPTPETQAVAITSVTSCICMWCFCVVVSISPILVQDVNIFSSSAMCMGFPLNTKHHVGWLFSLCIYTILPCVENGLKIIGLILILKVIFFDGSFVESEINNTKTLTFIILSHIFCGSIISITGLLSAVGINISPNRMGWLSVFVLPLNSIINPLLWIWQIVQQKWADYKASR